MMGVIREYVADLLADLAKLDPDLVLLTLLGVVSFVVLDRISAVLRVKRKAVGVAKAQPAKFAPGFSMVQLDGSKSLSVRTYVSEIQGLAGRPDALINEHGELIPVERKPLARKVRDRYVAQLLVYMRLVEEFEGRKPPYGYLVLGANARQIKVENSPERQAWLQGMLDEMRGILKGQVASKPQPHPVKCKKCDVKTSCAARGDLGTVVSITKKSAVNQVTSSPPKKDIKPEFCLRRR